MASHHPSIPPQNLDPSTSTSTFTADYHPGHSPEASNIGDARLSPSGGNTVPSADPAMGDRHVDSSIDNVTASFQSQFRSACEPQPDLGRDQADLESASVAGDSSIGVTDPSTHDPYTYGSSVSKVHPCPNAQK